MRNKIYLAAMLAVTMMMLSACQTGKEFHYFREGDNYYRLKVCEHAFLSSSRYQSGYYDEAAVDNYFGEIRRPDSSGRVLPKPLGTTAQNNEKMTIPEGTKLVMILSTNSDVVAAQIGSLAENEQTLELIARLSNKDIQTENTRLKENVRQLNAKEAAVIEQGKNTIAAIADADKTAANWVEIKHKLLDFINALAASTGMKTNFKTFTEAQKWYHETY